MSHKNIIRRGNRQKNSTERINKKRRIEINNMKVIYWIKIYHTREEYCWSVEGTIKEIWRILQKTEKIRKEQDKNSINTRKKKRVE